MFEDMPEEYYAPDKTEMVYNTADSQDSDETDKVDIIAVAIEFV